MFTLSKCLKTKEHLCATLGINNIPTDLLEFICFSSKALDYDVFIDYIEYLKNTKHGKLKTFSKFKKEINIRLDPKILIGDWRYNESINDYTIGSGFAGSFQENRLYVFNEKAPESGMEIEKHPTVLNHVPMVGVSRNNTEKINHRAQTRKKRILVVSGRYDLFSNIYPSMIRVGKDKYPHVWAAYFGGLKTPRCKLYGSNRLDEISINLLAANDYCGEPNIEFMKRLLEYKFQYNPERMYRLLKTNGKEITYTNFEHNVIWGVCKCSRCEGIGMNLLGRQLMDVRDEERARRERGKK